MSEIQDVDQAKPERLFLEDGKEANKPQLIDTPDEELTVYGRAAKAHAIAAAADAAEPPPPRAFKLERAEQLELQNIQLRGQVLQHQQQALGQEQAAWGVAVATAHGVNLSKYNINLQTGVCDLIQVGEPQVGGK